MENLDKCHVLRNYSSLATFLSLIVKADMHVQLCMVSSESYNRHTSGVKSGNHTLSWIGHSGSFKVNHTGVNRNLEWGVVVMHTNVSLTSET